MFTIPYVVRYSHSVHTFHRLYKKHFVGSTRPVSRPSSMLPFKDDCLIWLRSYKNAWKREIRTTLKLNMRPHFQ